MKLLISKHAINRFKERFRLHYNSSWFVSNRVPELMETLFNKSNRVSEFDLCPFYKNKLSTKHFSPLVMFRADDVVFVCTKTIDERWFIKTCLPVKMCKPWLTYD